MKRNRFFFSLNTGLVKAKFVCVSTDVSTFLIYSYMTPRRSVRKYRRQMGTKGCNYHLAGTGIVTPTRRPLPRSLRLPDFFSSCPLFGWRRFGRENNEPSKRRRPTRTSQGGVQFRSQSLGLQHFIVVGSGRKTDHNQNNAPSPA